MSQDEQQHRGGFVPIGELAGTPQARHHFTTLHQVNQLIEASEAEPDIGFMARLLALCSLPRTNPGDRLQFKRVNGPYTLGMIAGLGNKLPYGTLPRLLLAWVCTEAVRTQSRELVLGDSLSEFMRRLGIYSTSGGITGGRTRLRNQMRRLFGCTVSLIYEDARGEATLNAPIASRTEFWWGVGRSRVKAAHHSPAVRGRFVVVQLHRGPGADGTASMRDHSDRVRAAGWESGTTRGPSPPGRRCAAGRLRLRGT